MVIREDSASAGGCCALCSSVALRVAATPKMLHAARLRTQSRETRRIESAVILAAPRRQVAARPQLILALRLYLVHRRLYSSTVLVSGSQMQELVSFGMGIHSSRQSFPRKRESSPTTAQFQRFAEWIPAFAGMTALQMTPLPCCGRANVRCGGFNGACHRTGHHGCKVRICRGNLSLTNGGGDWIIDRTESFRRTFTSVQRT
jgi:hypothetical protein